MTKAERRAIFANVTTNDVLCGMRNSRIESKKRQKCNGTRYTTNQVLKGNVASNKAVDHRVREKRIKPTTYKMWSRESNEWVELRVSDKTYNRLKKSGEKVKRDDSQDFHQGDLIAHYNKVA